MHVLIAGATAQEVAVSDELDLCAGHTTAAISRLVMGVGPVTATYALTAAIRDNRPDAVLHIGLCGSYRSHLPPPSIVHVVSERFGDLGAEDHEQFLDGFDLGFFQADSFPFTGKRLVNRTRFLPAEVPLADVHGLTVSTTTGALRTLQLRQGRFDADIESMEGAAVFYCCLMDQVPFISIRAVSNWVEPRRREKWQVEKALKALRQAVHHYAPIFLQTVAAQANERK